MTFKIIVTLQQVLLYFNAKIILLHGAAISTCDSFEVFS